MPAALTDPYVVAAAILGWATVVAAVIAFFIGRDRLTHDNRPIWGEDDQ